MSNVFFTAKCGQNVARQIVAASGYILCVSLFNIIRRIFTARCSEVELPDYEAESEVVDDRKHKPYRDNQPPCCTVWDNPEEHIVDEPAGEGHPDFDIQDVHSHEGQTCEYGMYCEQQRSHEQEREFQRLGNPGQE
ncbi:hypothetical protein D3C75_882910 [compost metagenome]